jgi:uncharacterized membrane protein YuzA (DUF378 family)
MCNCKDGVCSTGGCNCHKCILAKIANVLVLVGGLNWGLTGLGMLIGTNLNVVNLLLGSMPTFEAVIYVVVGVCTIVKIFGCPCKTCKGEVAEAPKTM